jgi:hypothetical protein
VFILTNDFTEVLEARPDLNRADIYDIIDLMGPEETLLEAVNKYYPLNQRTGDCAA